MEYGMGLRGILSKEETELNQNINKLSDATLAALASAIQSLTNQDTKLAKSIVENDKHINQIQSHIQEMCISTIATQQPVATDLRVLVAILNIAAELERIADHAAGIANTVTKMAGAGAIDSLDDVVEMGNMCQSMLKNCMQAYFELDANLAKDVADSDDLLDQKQNQLTTNFLNKMCDDRDKITSGAFVLWIVHGLERIGDRATNICEQVLYIKNAEILDLNKD